MIRQWKGLHEYYNMGTKILIFFSKKFEIEFDLYFDLCWRAEIIQVGLNMHLYVDIGDASSSLWGSTSSCIIDTIHVMHSVGVCVSYVWQSLSEITEQLLADHQSGSQWTHSYQAASAQLGCRTNPQKYHVDV